MDGSEPSDDPTANQRSLSSVSEFEREQRKSYSKKISATKIKDIESLFCQTLAFYRKDFMAELYLQSRHESEMTKDDFELKATLGKGSFGTVFLVKEKGTEEPEGVYAMKVMEKHRIAKRKQVRHALEEKRMMSSISFPFVVSTVHSFKDNCNLYLVMPYLPCGDLFELMNHRGALDNNLAMFFAAQVVLGIEYLHDNDVLYRDLKPENILIDETGYIKIADLGFARIVHLRAWTFCGTPEYIAPEVVKSIGYSKPADWWSVGVLIYEMLTGSSPFHAGSDGDLFRNIMACKPHYPSKLTPEARNLLENMLVADPTRRYGNLFHGVMDIKSHPWFYPYDWVPLLYRAVEPPFTPVTRRVTKKPDKPMVIPESSKMLNELEFRDF